MIRRTLPLVDRPGPAGPEAEGWTRRFMAAGDRLVEATRLYGELGFEVRLERPGTTDLREECGDCHLALQQFRIVYTRRAP
jgi:hypothetical protein